MGTLSNREDPDELPYNASLHLVLHCFLRQKSILRERKIQHFGRIKETKSATLNIFDIFYFLFKLFVKVVFSYVFIINMFTAAKNCMEKLIIL